jgi:hypothetical protein
MAADRADVPLMRELVKAGADPLLPNADKSTPLMAAAGLSTSDPLEEAGTEDEALDAVKIRDIYEKQPVAPEKPQKP